MSKSICFIGEPRRGCEETLRVLRSAGLEPRRIQGDRGAIEQIVENPPKAFMVSDQVEDRRGIISFIQERAELVGTPVIAQVPSADPDVVERAFLDGADDFVVDGSRAQLVALTEALQSGDSWNALRAPNGLVVLAEEDRLKRVQLGRVLRRNGFDTHFASSLPELVQSLERVEPRAVVVSASLPGGSLHETLERCAGCEPGTPPWIVLGGGAASIAEGREIPPNVVFDEGGDAARLTFLMNEMLTPPPPNMRKTKRLLYGTPVRFTAEGSSDVFYGYSYNVNLGGIFIRSLSPLPTQVRVTVHFQPPFGRGEVVADGQIVWRRELSAEGAQASPSGMGVQFSGMAPADRAAFEAGYDLLLKEHEAMNQTLEAEEPIDGSLGARDTVDPPNPIAYAIFESLMSEDLPLLLPSGASG